MGGWETTKCDVFEMKGGKGGGGKDLWITVSCDGMELTDNSTGPTNSTGKRVPCKGDISFKTVHGSRCTNNSGVTSCMEGNSFSWCSTMNKHQLNYIPGRLGQRWFDYDLCSLCDWDKLDERRLTAQISNLFLFISSLSRLVYSLHALR